MYIDTLIFLKEVSEKFENELNTFITPEQREKLNYQEIHRGRLGKIIDEFLSRIPPS
jgi:hypothetical protein